MRYENLPPGEPLGHDLESFLNRSLLEEGA